MTLTAGNAESNQKELIHITDPFCGDPFCGEANREDNVLKNAPHTAAHVASDDWTHPYSRERAAYPLPFVRWHKFWPTVGRIDNLSGDRNLVCARQG